MIIDFSHFAAFPAIFGFARSHKIPIVIATTGLVFGSVYSLIMIHRAYFGPSKSDSILHGMDGRELTMVLGLAALLIYLGVYPQPFLDTSAATMHGVQQWLGTAFTQLASAR